MKTFNVDVSAQKFDVSADTHSSAVSKAKDLILLDVKEAKLLWRVGTVVKAKKSSDWMNAGTLGVVRTTSYGKFGVEFQAMKSGMGHSCTGIIPSGKGRWISEDAVSGDHENMDEFEVIIH